MTILIAMNRADSVRSYDADGRLHVVTCNISKVNVRADMNPPRPVAAGAFA